MIYNRDFVTNSSSTSFVLLLKDKNHLNQKDFLDACGVDKNSPLISIYKQLYKLISEDYSWEEVYSFEDIANITRGFGQFSKDELTEIKQRMENGEKAYTGTISDDTAVGAYFLQKRVVVVGDTFYFNWEPNAY